MLVRRGDQALPVDAVRRLAGRAAAPIRAVIRPRRGADRRIAIIEIVAAIMVLIKKIGVGELPALIAILAAMICVGMVERRAEAARPVALSEVRDGPGGMMPAEVVLEARAVVGRVEQVGTALAVGARIMVRGAIVIAGAISGRVVRVRPTGGSRERAGRASPGRRIARIWCRIHRCPRTSIHVNSIHRCARRCAA